MKLLLIALLTANFAVAASNTKMITCLLDRDQGGGKADMFVNDEGWVSLSAQIKADAYIHLAFTRTFNELGVIDATDHVVAVSYSDHGKHCTKGVDTRDITCNEKLGEVGIVTHQRDKNGTVHEKHLAVQFDNVEIKSQKTEDGASWMWEFVKDGKWAYTNVVNLVACEYGQHHWQD